MTLVASIFALGYLLIALERPLRIDKAAVALVLGGALWILIANTGLAGHEPLVSLGEHLSGTAAIVFFLLSAMTIVEVIDRHDGFSFISSRITTKDPRDLVWIVGFVAFFLSAILDNLTTTIVMITITRRLIGKGEARLVIAGIIVIAANAGGAFSPIGDVTTTMLWMGGKISPVGIISRLFLPSVLSLVIPLVLATLMLGSKRYQGASAAVEAQIPAEEETVAAKLHRRESFAIFLLGVLLLMSIPAFNFLTGLPPWLGIVLALGILWFVTELMHRGKEEEVRSLLGPVEAFTRIDLPSIMFFIGILLAVGALEASGVLRDLSAALGSVFADERPVVFLLGVLSSVVDNVPLVAGAMGMFDPAAFPMDHRLWEFLAFCAGTGGSMLVIGSAAGVVAMGLEGISFGWYLRKITPLAVVGYVAGALTYLLAVH